jgi:hypothetical protein
MENINAPKKLHKVNDDDDDNNDDDDGNDESSKSFHLLYTKKLFLRDYSLDLVFLFVILC